MLLSAALVLGLNVQLPHTNSLGRLRSHAHVRTAVNCALWDDLERGRDDADPLRHVGESESADADAAASDSGSGTSTDDPLRKILEKLSSNPGGMIVSGPMDGLFGMDEDDDDDDDDDDAADGAEGGGAATAESVALSLRHFDLLPKEVVAHLDRFVIKQQEAKKVLSVATCDHYNHVRRCLADPAVATQDYSKPNILLVGPTGVGKTYLMRNIARLIGVPFVTADATKFSETGVVGKDAEDLVRELVDRAGGNATLASYGIIYVDEVDKICNPGGKGAAGGPSFRGGWNTRGVQNNFLKLLEDAEVPLQSPMSMGAMMGGGRGKKTISTRHMLFIFSGAFTDLDASLREKRKKKSALGFDIGDDDADADGADDDGDEAAAKSALRHATTADFVEAGLEPEFIGRVPVRVACDALVADDLLEILTRSEGSVLRQFVRDFDGYGVEMSTERAALQQVASLAADEGTGARGLVTILERTLRDHKYELPSSSVTAFTVDNATVVDPQAALTALLATQTTEHELELGLRDVKRYEARLRRELEPLQVWMTDEATDELILQSRREHTSAYALASRAFEALPDAVRAVHAATGQTQFPISLSLAREPEKEIEQWMQMVRGARERAEASAE